jgi:hypothetical protein
MGSAALLLSGRAGVALGLESDLFERLSVPSRGPRALACRVRCGLTHAVLTMLPAVSQRTSPYRLRTCSRHRSPWLSVVRPLTRHLSRVPALVGMMRPDVRHVTNFARAHHGQLPPAAGSLSFAPAVAARFSDPIDLVRTCTDARRINQDADCCGPRVVMRQSNPRGKPSVGDPNADKQLSGQSKVRGGCEYAQYVQRY